MSSWQIVFCSLNHPIITEEVIERKIFFQSNYNKQMEIKNCTKGDTKKVSKILIEDTRKVEVVVAKAY